MCWKVNKFQHSQAKDSWRPPEFRWLSAYDALPFSAGGLYFIQRRGTKPLLLASREDSQHGDCQFGYQLNSNCLL
jgi:hypothetical protein